MKSTKHEQVTQARRAYQKQWRSKNKERVRQYNQRYWERRAEREESSERRTRK